MDTFQARWLSEDRLRVYPVIFLGLYVVALLVNFAGLDGLVDAQGRPLGTDFSSFYAAAQLAIEGQAHLAYDHAAHFAMEKQAIPTQQAYYSFFYPPSYFLFLLPFGLLPYIWAYLAWQGVTLAFYALMVRKFSEGQSFLLLLAFPAVFVCLGHGQNAFLSTGLIAGALHYLGKRPVVAGVFIGLLTFKPHLGVLLPLVLILGRHYRAFVGATITSLGLASLSGLIVGIAPWQAFLANGEAVRATLVEGVVSFAAMQSLFSSLRNMGVPTDISFLLHGVLALMATVAVSRIWLGRADERLKFAALGIATCLISPFFLDYDLMILIIPLLCLLSYFREKGFVRGGELFLTAVWVAPLIARQVNDLLPLPWVPMLLALLLVLIYRLVNRLETAHS